jgi:hypothetical protein
MRKSLTTLLLFFSFIPLHFAQIQGVVKGSGGEVLPFASIYIQNTSTGTTTNIEGNFSFDLEKGKHKIVFQYVGYRSHFEEIEVKNAPVFLEIFLENETINLVAIEIVADSEDPAYEIIRKAISKRKYYKELVQESSCEVYIKGNVKLLNAPERILGKAVGDFDGSLDSTRRGIVYLSESESILNFKQPDLYKEIMISSKVSGSDNGFSFNNAMSMDLSLYRNTTEFGRSIVSPIAENALSYYEYKLHGTLFDGQGKLLNKIEVIPKRKEDPVIQGFIYIVEDYWNIQSANFFLTGISMKWEVFDTLFVEQVHVPIQSPNIWQLFSQNFRFSGGVFGFKYVGNYTGVYTNYNLQPNFQKDFFDNEVFKVEEGANERDSSYWESIRPIPITDEEGIDYLKKDSLKIVRKSKAYLDSLDQKANRFGVENLFFGYTFSKSYQGNYFQIKPLLTTFLFNTVQGWNSNLRISWRKNFDDDWLKWIRINANFTYGFSEEKFRNAYQLTYNLNRQNYTQFNIWAGTKLAQFNENDPINNSVNAVYSVFFRKNYARFYEKDFARIQYRRELFNGVLMYSSLEFAKRKPLENFSDFSFFYNNSREYDSNIPNNEFLKDGIFELHKSVILALNFRLRINQKYISYPNEKYIMGSKFPDFWIRYTRGVPVFENGSNFDKLAFQIQEKYLSIGVLGYLQYNIKVGWFLSNKNAFFQDYKHFNGNLTEIGTPNEYINSFMLLPYYQESTDQYWTELHFEHHFEGYILDKVPLIRKLGWTTVFGSSFLYTNNKMPYNEFNFGIENIGKGIFRFFRIDGVCSFRKGSYDKSGFIIGIDLPIS